MKVLFICRGNVARSQLAEAIYNKLTNSHDAQSAGTQVSNPSESLIDRKRRLGESNAVDVMRDNNLLSENQKQTQLTKNMVDNFDLIISMAGKRYTPKWLSKNPKYRYWKITDPKARGYNFTDSTRKQIESKIRETLLD
jgi:protein-tyrosine-phosphatase